MQQRVVQAWVGWTGMRCLPVMLLICATLVSTGCGPDPKVLRGWSSQKSWDYMEDSHSDLLNVLGIITKDQNKYRAQEAEADFDRSVVAAAVSDRLPPGGLEALLDDLKDDGEILIRRATPGLAEGATGIILFKKITGPAGQDLANDVDAKVSKAKFLNALQVAQGVKGDWFVLGLSIEEFKEMLKEADAVPGQVVKLGVYEFVYNPANIYTMHLGFTAKAFSPDRALSYTGTVTLVQVQSATQVQGAAVGQVRYFYQPFGKEWLTEEEEKRRLEVERGGGDEEGPDISRIPFEGEYLLDDSG